MRTFTVLAPLVNAESGSTVTEKDLDGVNIAALIASGHLKEKRVGKTQTTDPATDTIATELEKPATDQPQEGTN